MQLFFVLLRSKSEPDDIYSFQDRVTIYKVLFRPAMRSFFLAFCSCSFLALFSGCPLTKMSAKICPLPKSALLSACSKEHFWALLSALFIAIYKKRSALELFLWQILKWESIFLNTWKNTGLLSIPLKRAPSPRSGTVCWNSIVPAHFLHDVNERPAWLSSDV